MLTVTQQYRDRVAVSGPAGELVYRHGKLPKSCLHPLTTPAGRVITGFEMSDHTWHRGLWFAIKFINGTNFWEEHEPYGVQEHRGTAGEPAVDLLDESTVRITSTIEWTSAATGPVVGECRVITHRLIAPGVAAVDWSCRLIALQDLVLDRTPFTTWGGYGGLILRTSREFHKAHLLLPTGVPTQQVAGTPGEWIVMNGLLDGGRDVKASFGFVDHPSNPRSPSPWYSRCTPEVNYINAAFLFNEPMTVAKGQTLSFDYRVLLKDGHFTQAEFAPLAEAFRSSTPEIA